GSTGSARECLGDCAMRYCFPFSLALFLFFSRFLSLSTRAFSLTHSLSFSFSRAHIFYLSPSVFLSFSGVLGAAAVYFYYSACDHFEALWTSSSLSSLSLFLCFLSSSFAFVSPVRPKQSLLLPLLRLP